MKKVTVQCFQCLRLWSCPTSCTYKSLQQRINLASCGILGFNIHILDWTTWVNASQGHLLFEGKCYSQDVSKENFTFTAWRRTLCYPQRWGRWCRSQVSSQQGTLKGWMGQSLPEDVRNRHWTLHKLWKRKCVNTQEGKLPNARLCPQAIPCQYLAAEKQTTAFVLNVQCS